MSNVRRIYVEKKEPYAVKAKELHDELKNYLGIDVAKVREFIRYDVENISDEVFARACKTVLYLFSKGYRFRKNDKRYPGKPDIVLPKYHVAIFVHGCSVSYTHLRY